MSPTELQGIVDRVVDRARVQGFVVPREIRATLAEAKKYSAAPTGSANRPKK